MHWNLRENGLVAQTEVDAEVLVAQNLGEEEIMASVKNGKMCNKFEASDMVTQMIPVK
jgi:hypothetical protein